MEDGVDLVEERLCNIVMQHFQIDARTCFGCRGKALASQDTGGGAASNIPQGGLSLEAFVSSTLALLELEREAEIKQASLSVKNALLHGGCTSADGILDNRQASCLAANSRKLHDCRLRPRLAVRGWRDLSATVSCQIFAAQMLRPGYSAGRCSSS